MVGFYSFIKSVRRRLSGSPKLGGWKAFVVIALSAVSVLGCRSDQPADAQNPSKTSGAHSSKPAKLEILPHSEAISKVDVVPVLLDIGREVGIDFTFFSDAVPGRYFLPEVMGGGVAWIDFDADGHLDLFVTDGCSIQDSNARSTEHRSRMYRNLDGNRFEEVTNRTNTIHNAYGQGCAVGDFDSDGFSDLFCANFGADTLFHNNGDGTFDEMTKQADMTGELWGSSAAWFDVDDDGDLDLYVANYLDVTLANSKICSYSGKPGYCGPGQYDAVPDYVYVNGGDGTFTEAGPVLGFASDNGKGLAVSVLDFNDDLKPEVFVANDMTANFLFTRSNANLTTFRPAPKPHPYIEVATTSGCAVSDDGDFEASMGVACADFDKDGRPDIYLTHYYNHKNTLYRNLGNLSFTDDSRRTRVAAISYSSLGFGTVAFDYDRNGWSDLIIANGHVLGPHQEPNEMQAQLLRNDGTGRFDDISTFAGPYFEETSLARSIGSADFDNDGDLDFAITHLDRHLALLRNETKTGGNFVGLDLRTKSRIPPVGGRVVVIYGKQQTVMPIVAGGSYLSSSDTRLLFGLGDLDEPVQVVVHWPSGRVDEFNEVQVDRYWRITEGGQPELLRLSEASTLQ